MRKEVCSIRGVLDRNITYACSKLSKQQELAAQTQLSAESILLEAPGPLMAHRIRTPPGHGEDSDPKVTRRVLVPPSSGPARGKTHTWIHNLKVIKVT